MSKVYRVVGIAPTSRGFGFAVLEDGDRLVDWGLAHCRPPNPERVVERALALFARHGPDLLVLQATEGSRYGRRAKRFLALLEEKARSTGVAVTTVSSDTVRRRFASHGLTKHDRVVAIAQQFPELRPRQPARRRPWQSQDERIAIFDSTALALSGSPLWPPYSVGPVVSCSP